MVDQIVTYMGASFPFFSGLCTVDSKSVKVTVGVIPAQVPGTTAGATSTRGPASVSATRACSET